MGSLRSPLPLLADSPAGAASIPGTLQVFAAAGCKSNWSTRLAEAKDPGSRREAWTVCATEAVHGDALEALEAAIEYAVAAEARVEVAVRGYQA